MDGVAQPSLTRSVSTYLPYCQLGLVTEDATANFTGLKVANHDAWGASVAGNDTANKYGGGVQTGSWTVNNSQGLDETTNDGDSWDSIFGDSNLTAPNYTFSAGMAQVSKGTNSPKYGMYACYKDGSNYMSGWIDSTNGQFDVHSVVGGTASGWATTALPTGFDPTVQHVVKVAKSGGTYTFSIDGVTQTNATATLSGCQVGLVTQDTRVQYRSVNVP